MRIPRLRLRLWRTAKEDAVAGVVLGVQSVPDGLATGLLAGVSPLSGLYGYLVGTAVGAVCTSSAFMAVQSTGAMAMVMSDVPALTNSADPARALVTLSVLTGVTMLVAGLLKLGALLRFVSNAVMVGFINAVGVNIVLGQLSNLTGYAAEGGNRVVRAFNTVVNPSELHWRSVAIGVATIVLIVVLERTRLGALGLVVAVVVTSVVLPVFSWDDVATLRSLDIIPDSLPTLEWPMLRLVPVLLVPALSLAFVGLVQGAGISASFPNPDGSTPDASRDFAGQGAANVASGLFQGMPVGGSVSASALNHQAGARSRWALVCASAVMAIVIVALGGVVAYVAMPALAGLLMLIGYRTVKPYQLVAVWKTGTVQKMVMTLTFGLTMFIPLQFAVLWGVALSVVLNVIRQSNQVTVRRRLLDAEDNFIETDPPSLLPGGEVVVLQPYGSLFFAAAPVFEAMLPVVEATSRRSVVILRLRGRSDLGTTFMDVLERYAHSLDAVGSKLVIVTDADRVVNQLQVTGLLDAIGVENLYFGDERVGAAVKRAHADATRWLADGS
jgi:sulfate permease, SulP family